MNDAAVRGADRDADRGWAYWYRRIWRLSWPIILSNVTVPLVGAVDTAVVGHLPSPHYIGAVALGSLIFNYLYWGLGFLRMGTTGLVGQANGAGDDVEVRGILGRAILLSLVLGVLIILISGPIAGLAFGVLDGSAEVETAGRDYFTIRIWAAPASLCNIVLLGWFYGMQRPWAALIQQLTVNISNMVLNVVLVFGFDMGLAGVAIATVIAQTLGLVLGVWLIRRELGKLATVFTRLAITNWPRYGVMMRVNRDIFLRTVMLITGTAYFMNASAAQGDLVLAANTVLMVFQMIASYAMDGFTHAIEPLVGEAVGRGNRCQLRSVVITGAVYCCGFSVIIALTFWFFGAAVIGLMTDIPSVAGAAHTYLIWVAVLPVISGWSFLLDGIFIGATRSAEMRNAMAVSLAGFLAIGFVLSDMLSNHGLWLAYTLFISLRAITLVYYYPRIVRDIS
jgi:MATE family multidrug resistance protein